MTETMIFAQNEELTTVAFVGGALLVAYAVLWAFVPLAVARIWAHTYRAAHTQKQLLAEAKRTTEAVRDCHKVLYSIWAAGYQGDPPSNGGSRAPSRQIPAPAGGTIDRQPEEVGQ